MGFPNAHLAEKFVENDVQKAPVIALMEQCGVVINNQLQQLIDHSTLADMEDALDYLRQKQSRENVFNPSGYIFTVLKDRLK